MRVVLAILLAVTLAAGAWLLWRPAPPPADPLGAAWAQVVARPREPAGWVRLAEVQLEVDDQTSAEHALRTALTLGDARGLAHARLGFLLFGQGRDAEARALLLEARRRGADAPMLEDTLAALAPAPSPPSRPGGVSEPAPSPPVAPALDAGFAGLDATAPAPRVAAASAPDKAPVDPEACQLTLHRVERGVFLVDVVVAGVPGRLVLDTGASMTVLTEAFTARAGLTLDTRRVVRAMTANGQVEMPTALADTVQLGPHASAEVRVAVCRDCVEGLADGLLGLDLQAAARLQVDAAAGQAFLGDCP